MFPPSWPGLASIHSYRRILTAREAKATLRTWADEGAELSDFQKRLAEELEIKITYLETRFLLEDLGIELKPKEEPEPEAEAEDESSDEVTDAVPEDFAPDAPADAGDVTVTVDSVLRPGALISGRAEFAGGKSAAWWLDQMGRLGMDPSEPDFRPSDEEMRAFQIALQKKIQETGM